MPVLKAPVTAHVLLVDSNRTRRRLLAGTFRAAGCVVVETSKEHEVTRTLAHDDNEWVLAVAGACLTTHFCDGFPHVPVIRLGGQHQDQIGGRLALGSSPGLASAIHALVGPRGSVT